MTAEQFAYWMQGFAELTGDNPPTKAQWKSIKEHLQTVFVKVTPPLNFTPDVNDPRRAPRPYQPGIPPLDWQRPATPGSPQKPLIATCIAVPAGTATTLC